MFIERDITKRVIKPKYFLAKPNMEVISSIHEAFGDDITFKLGDINELVFSIPYQVEEDMQLIDNPHTQKIKERMLIKCKMGPRIEYFLVDSINEDGSDEEVFTVKTFSLAYELRGTRTPDFEEDAISPKELLDQVLADSPWTLKTVAPKFLTMYRGFAESKSNALDIVLKVKEVYEALPLFDTEKREIHLVDFPSYGSYKGMSVDYGQLLENVSLERASENLVTRLYIEGSDGLTISSVNPTGRNYIEDFSYFMHPFEQDAQGNVIQHSDFMSDALCKAILAQQKQVEQNETQIKNLISQRTAKITQVVNAESTLANLLGELDTILVQLDLAKATNDTALISQRNAEKNAKQTQVSSQQVTLNNLRGQLTTIENSLDALYAGIDASSNLTPELQKELKLYTISQDFIDDRYIDAQELYDAGLEKFKELRIPLFTGTIGLVNFLEMVEEEVYWDKLNLGDTIKVKHPRMNLIFFAKLIEIQRGSDGEAISVTISNTTRTQGGFGKLADAIRQSSFASNVVQGNKKKWDKAGEDASLVAQMMNEEYDANKQRIIAGVNNLIEIGKRGIIVRSPDFPDEIIVIQSGIIALSRDNGATWETAITPRGIIAERLMGRILAGENLLITNSSGSFTMDENGAVFNVGSFVVRSGSGNVNLVDRWQDSSSFLTDYTDDNVLTPFEKRMLRIKWDDIKKRYDTNLVRITHHFKNDADTKSFVITYKQKYQELYNYLFVTNAGAYPMLADQNMGNATSINGDLFNQRFKDYDSALVELEKEFDFNLQERITNVQFVITDDEIMSAVKRTEDWTVTIGGINQAISNADGKAQSATQSLTDMMSNLTVTPIEKSTLALIWSEIKSQYTQWIALAATVNVSSTAYNTAYTNLNGVTPKIEDDILANMSATYTFTATTRTNFKAKLDTYFLEAEKLNKAVNEKVNSTANDAKNGLADLMSDLKITPLEKNELLRTWQQIQAEYLNLNAQANTMGIDTVTRTDYTNAYNALNTTAPRIQTDILANMTTTYTLTTTTRDALRSQMNSYFTNAEKVSKAISESIKKYVDDLEIGGSNLVPNSAGNLDEVGEVPTYWAVFQNATDMKAQIAEEGYNYISATVTATQGGLRTPITPIVGGQTYTVAFEMRADKVANLSHLLKFRDAAGVESNPIGTQTQASVVAGTWHRFVLTFVAPATAVSVATTPRITSTDAFPYAIEIRNLQIEKGSKDTTWAPATEDMIRQFVLLRTKVSSVEQSINADSIVTTITSSETYKNLMDSKADAEAIGDLATKEELDKAMEDLELGIGTAIAGIDFTPYVTALDLEQTSKNITAKFSATGGMNLIKNSVGYADFTFWNVVSAQFIQTMQNTALDTLGFGSGFDFRANTVSARIEQNINVVVGSAYTLSWYLNKPSADGSVWFEILEEGVVKHSTAIATAVTTTGYESSYINYTPSVPVITIRIMSQATASVTGLMFSIGDVALQWSLATGEVYNSNIRMDINGIRVSQFDSTGREVGFTRMNYEEFAGFYDTKQNGIFEKVFYIREDETVSKKFRAINEITMGSLKIIKVESGTNHGWAFVPIVPQ